jgi:hypothetical protein
MLWFMLLLFSCGVSESFWAALQGGPSAAAPTPRVLLYLLALLGIPQAIVTTIDILGFTIAILLG